MADEPLSIRGVHWREALPFTHLFRAFRVAIHPSKIVLALAALLLSYVGGRALDLVWPVQDRAVPDEVTLYERYSGHPAPGQAFADVRRSARAGIESAYAARLLGDQIVTDPAAAATAAHGADRLADLKQYVISRRTQAVTAADRDLQIAVNASGTATDPPAARRAAEAGHRSAVRAAYDAASAEYAADSRIKNTGLYDAFFDYESRQLSNAVQGVLAWNWFGSDPSSTGDAPAQADDLTILLPPGSAVVGTTALPRQTVAGIAGLNPLGLAPAPPSTATPVAPALPAAASSPGIVPSIYRFFAVGPVWLVTQHWVYAALFGTGFLVLWSVFGGGISRIAAVHVARDEKLSIRSALVFSGGKFLSYLCAPLIPLAILVAVGVGVTVVSLLGAVPWLGPIVLGLGFVLALMAGLVMAVVLVGLVGGFNLMYPTIAVEGSDSFDAISRSFSYLYARPWRLAFYTAVSLVYGAACYLFVRLFIYLVLTLTHRFVGLGVFTHAGSTAPLLSAMWPDPATSGRLSYSVDALALTPLQEIGAALIWFWVHLAIAVLGAFAVTFYFSANTIIYYLLRQDVDATDLNEVYVDPADEDDADDEPDPADPVPTAKPSAFAPAAAAGRGDALNPADPADAAPPT